MSKLKSESDYVAGAAVNYGNGIGYYTNHTHVSDLLNYYNYLLVHSNMFSRL